MMRGGGMTAGAVQSLIAANQPVVTQSVPISGATVTAATDSKDATYWLKPAGTLATLTFAFPSDANSRPGQIIRIGSTKVITLLTLNGAASILNGVTAMAINDLFSFQKVDTDTWALI